LYPAKRYPPSSAPSASARSALLSRVLGDRQSQRDPVAAGERAHRGPRGPAQRLAGRQRADRLRPQPDRDHQRRGHRAQRRQLGHLCGDPGRAEQHERVDQSAVERGGDALRARREQQRRGRVGVLAVYTDHEGVDGQLRRVGVDEGERGKGRGHAWSP
jgi:hypothetical protein